MKRPLLVALFPLLALPAYSAITVSNIAPTVDGADIAQTLTQFGKSLNTSTSLGQSITTGTDTAGYSLSSFTFRNNSAQSGLVGLTFAVRVVEIDSVKTSGTINFGPVLSTQSGLTYTGNLAVGDFLTFNLTPVTLAANKIYGIEVDVTSNGTGSAFSGQMSARGSNAYAGGNFYTTGINFANTSGSYTANTEDLTFYTDLSVVPEPATALLGGLGVLTLLRRRRA